MSFLGFVLWVVGLTALITLSTHAAYVLGGIAKFLLKAFSFMGIVVALPATYLLSDYTKRLLVLGSLVGHVVKNPPETLDPEVMEHIHQANVALRLVKERGDESALQFPVLLHNHVWGEVNVSTSDVDVIVSRIPRFLRYAERDKMRQDIETVLVLSHNW